MRNPYGSVTVEDFKVDLLRVPEAQREGFLQNVQRISRLSENLLINKSLAEMARREGRDKDPDFDRRVRLQVEKLLAEAQVEHFEKEKARDFDARRRDFEKRAEESYAIDKKKYEVPERIAAWHILVRTDGKDPAEARTRIDRVLGRLKQGEDFEALAREVSEDQGSASQGGALSPFTRQQMDTAFADAAFALEQPGQVSPVVQSRFGFHVIKLKERLAGRQQSFAEVKPALMEQLKAQYVKESRETLYRSFFEPPAFQADVDLMRSLQTSIDMKTPNSR